MAASVVTCTEFCCLFSDCFTKFVFVVNFVWLFYHNGFLMTTCLSFKCRFVLLRFNM